MDTNDQDKEIIESVLTFARKQVDAELKQSQDLNSVTGGGMRLDKLQGLFKAYSSILEQKQNYERNQYKHKAWIDALEQQLGVVIVGTIRDFILNLESEIALKVGADKEKIHVIVTEKIGLLEGKLGKELNALIAKRVLQ